MWAEPPEASSVFEELQDGTLEIDELDWAAEGQKRVQEGSDGLWLRLAQPAPDDKDDDDHHRGRCSGCSRCCPCFSTCSVSSSAAGRRRRDAVASALQCNPYICMASVAMIFALLLLCQSSVALGNFCTEVITSYSYVTQSSEVQRQRPKDPQLGDPLPPQFPASELQNGGTLGFWQGQLAVADPNVAYGACSSQDGLALPTSYPCQCGGQQCEYGSLCNAGQCQSSSQASAALARQRALLSEWGAMEGGAAGGVVALEGSLAYVLRPGVTTSGVCVGGCVMLITDGWDAANRVEYDVRVEVLQVQSVQVPFPAVYEGLEMSETIEEKRCYWAWIEFEDWGSWLVQAFTWLFALSTNAWLLFLLWLALSRYGTMKLGQDEDLPELSSASWFALLFTASTATSLLFLGASSEPMWHFLTDRYFNGPGTDSPFTFLTGGAYQFSSHDFAGVVTVAGSGGEVEQAVYSTINSRVQSAMTLTWFHHGFHAWAACSLLALLLAFLHFRKGLPLTVKTSLYPLVGDRIFGLAGDSLDALCCAATALSLAAAMGLAAMQVDRGIERLNGGEHWLPSLAPNGISSSSAADGGAGAASSSSPSVVLAYYNNANFEDWEVKLPMLESYWSRYPQDAQRSLPWLNFDGSLNKDTAAAVAEALTKIDQQVVLVWLMTAIAGCALLLAGLRRAAAGGLRCLAQLGLLLGSFLLFYVWMLDDGWFLTNLFVQTLGHYLLQLPVLGFQTLAVEQSEVGNYYSAAAFASSSGQGGGSGEQGQAWLRQWTLFHLTSALVWAPFLGIFLARISKGRTIRQFLAATLLAAVSFNFLFISVLGGAGLKMQLLAERYEVGTSSCGQGPDPVLTAEYFEDQQVAQGGGATGGEEGSSGELDRGETKNHPYKSNLCRPVGGRKYNGELEMQCSTVTNLACTLRWQGPEEVLYDVISQYSDVGRFLTFLLLVSAILFLATSQAAAALACQQIACNGSPGAFLPGRGDGHEGGRLEGGGTPGRSPTCGCSPCSGGGGGGGLLLQRLFWCFLMGLAATLLLTAGKGLGPRQGATSWRDLPLLAAQQALQVLLGLPMLLLLSLLCLSFYRGLLFESNERLWRSGFSTDLLDFGVTCYDVGPSPAGPALPAEGGAARGGGRWCSRLCSRGSGGGRLNLEVGRLDLQRVRQILLALVLPVLPLARLTPKLQELRRSRQEARPSSLTDDGSGGAAGVRAHGWEKLRKLRKLQSTFLLGSLFYLWLFFLVLEVGVPVAETGTPWGSSRGTTAEDGPISTAYDVSTRYGHFHQWANAGGEERGVGQQVHYNEDFQRLGQGQPNIVVFKGAYTAVGVGDAMPGHSGRRLAAVGWFLFFLFSFCLAMMRSEVREYFGIEGSLLEDFLSCLLWPTALLQIADQVDEPLEWNNKADEDAAGASPES